MNNPALSRYELTFAAIGCTFVLLAVGCPAPQSSVTESAENPTPPNVRNVQQTVEAEIPAVDESSDSRYLGSAYDVAYQDEKYPAMFTDWKKPALTLFFTGRQHGYIEPCGCTGLANQKGGLSRRHVLFEELDKKGFNPIALDIGNQVRRFGRQPEIKFQTTVSGLKKMDYAAIGYGPDDLRLSTGELLSAAIGVDGEPAPFVCANVNILGQTPALKILEFGGKKIGLTAILGKAEQRGITSDEIELTDAEAALEKVTAKLEDAKCDLYILLAHTTIDESKRLGGKFPLFDLVVTAGSQGEPAHRLEPIEGSKGQLVQIGTKGMYVSAVGVFDGGEERFRLQRAPLDGRFADSKEMLGLMAAYQQQLEAVGLEGLGVKPLAHPSGRTFVGSAACADCHDAEYEIWKETPHAHATDSIVNPAERSEIPRHHDPECLSCHVTGWNPQEYYPYKSGYESLENSKAMTQMGCENCHGPGSHHVAAENGELDDAEKYRDQMVLTLDKARDTCLQCHDLDNSPAFHLDGAFEKYWERVKH